VRGQGQGSEGVATRSTREKAKGLARHRREEEGWATKKTVRVVLNDTYCYLLSKYDERSFVDTSSL